MGRKKVLGIIGLVIFIALVVGVSYSYFVYNKDIADVSMLTGDISIDLINVNGSLNLINTLPKADNYGMTSADYINFSINSKVDTKKIYYEIYILPRKGNTLNTDYLKVYLTDQENTTLTSVTLYDQLPDATVENGKAIYRDIINLNNDYSTKTETKNFRLRMWLDESYTDLTAKSFNFDIYLYAKNVAEDYRVIPPICKRVTKTIDLNTQTCERNSSYCYADGYYIGGSEDKTSITYGNAKEMNTNLTTGDAFDCNVNGSGYNERFYYVSDKWIPGTNINNFDNSTAVLIYYQNFVNGEVSTNGTSYNTDNWHGPLLSNFPKTYGEESWKEALLTSYSRTIYACDNVNCTNTPTLTTNSGGNTIANPVNYSGVATRLLSLPELIKGCKSVNSNTSMATNGSLKKCNFLFEGTKYASNSSTVDGIWLETPSSSNNNIMAAVANNRKVDITSGNTYGIRPVIEISKDDIEY